MTLVAAELLKLRTTRGPYLLALAILVIAGLTAAGIVGAGGLEDDERALSLMDAVESASLLAMVLGVVLVTNEYRHGTVTATFLAEPRRERVLVAKLALGALVGAAIGVGAALLGLAVALPWLSSRDEPLPVDAELAAAAARLVLAYSVAVALGVAVGALVHSQLSAVVGVFAWFLVVEQIVIALSGLAADFDDNPVARYLPGSVTDAIVSTGGGDVPRPAVGIALALAYVAAIFAAGAAVTVRRDVA